MTPIRIRVLTVAFALALMIFTAVPVSADPIDGGVPNSVGTDSLPVDGGVD